MKLRTFAATALLALVAPGFAAGQSDDKVQRTLAARGAQQPAPPPAAAAHIEVLVLEGSSGDGGVAPSLASIPQLRQPPFNTFSQITVVSRVTLALSSSPSSTAVPGGTARVTLAGRSPEGRYTVDVAFAQGGHASTIQFVASAGEPFFTVRRRPDRALIYGFIVRP